jgi:hypothetical protein
VFHVEVNCQCTNTAPLIFGTNDETAYTAERDERFYLNTADPAPCNGTVNGWRYCFYNPNDVRNQRTYSTTFAVYRAVGTGYEIVSGSITTVSRSGRDINTSQRLNCHDVSVNSFQIEAGDFAAACIYDPSGPSRRQLDLIGRGSRVTSSLMRTGNADQCSDNSLPSNILSSQLSNRNSRILHLYATITGIN